MTTILTVHQPLYLPWLGFFQKISMSDVYCFLDNVQFSSTDFTHKNRIKTPNGPVTITVPIYSKNHLNKTIDEMEIDNSKIWYIKHWKSISMAYAQKAPYFDSYCDFFERTFNKKWNGIAELDMHILNYLFDEMDISVEVVKASDYKFEGAGSDLILDICEKLDANLHIFGENGTDYANIESFNKSSVEVFFQKYKHPVYPQLYGNFTSHLSIIDLLFCFGEKSYDILTKNNPTKEDLIKKFNL